MSAPENFVSRWSRLKRQTAEEARAEPPQSPAQPPATPAPSEPDLDLSSLPPLEEITANTDIRAFLQSGVPAELAKAALRRAWASDPAIRDFVGLAENQWDFTDPASIPGFGQINCADEVRQHVARALGSFDEATASTRETAPQQETRGGDARSGGEPDRHESPQQVTAAQDETANSTQVEPPIEPEQSRDSVASQHGASPAESTSIRSRRGHGSALPR